MNKISLKLVASILSIMTAVTLIVGVTYAWVSMSTSPEVAGIKISIGGSGTIMLAPDQEEVIRGPYGSEKKLHYPGEFSTMLTLSEYDTYDYLSELSGLSPVSTSDGLYWVLPTYNEETGKINPVSEFEVDGTLSNADGIYAYLDFWVLAPGKEYTLRVSTDVNNKKGSYLIELPNVIEKENNNFTLDFTDSGIGAYARVGFLVNSKEADEDTMSVYTEDGTKNTHYKSLQGVYQEPGEEVNLNLEHQFTIYEPNGTSHPGGAVEEGTYAVTSPLWYNPYGNTILEENINGRLTVQNKNTWGSYGTEPLIEQIFQTSIANVNGLTAESAADRFYNKYLQGQVGTYVDTGEFFASTAALYAASENGITSSTAGASDDAIITTLKADTPQRIRMFIWLEGQDIDCANNNHVKSGQISLNIELAGANE